MPDRLKAERTERGVPIGRWEATGERPGDDGVHRAFAFADRAEAARFVARLIAAAPAHGLRISIDDDVTVSVDLLSEQRPVAPDLAERIGLVEALADDVAREAREQGRSAGAANDASGGGPGTRE